MVIHVEVSFSGFPFIAGFGQERADQAQQGRFIGEQTRDAGAAFEFHVDPFERVGSAQAALVSRWEGEDGEALRQVFLHPGGEFGRGGGVSGNDFLEPGFGAGAIRAVQHRANGLRDRGTLIQTRHISLGVLLKMELTALPGHARINRAACGGQSPVVVADEEQRRVEAALLQAGEEGAPVGFGFAESDADTENGAFAIRPNPKGDEHGAIQHLSALTHFFVTGVQEDIDTSFERSVAPAFQFEVQFGGALADLGGTDGVAAELFHNGGDFAGGDTLDIHFGQGQLEGLLAADAFFEGAGIEVQIAAHLRDLELDRAKAGDEGLGFEAVGVALAGISAFVGQGLERLGTFLAHGFVDEQADTLGEAAGTFFIEQLQNGVQKFRIALVGHLGFELVVLVDTPTGNHRDPPSTSFSRAERLHPSGVRLRSARSARYARLRSPSPRRGGGGGKKDKLQKEFYTPLLEVQRSIKGTKDAIIFTINLGVVCGDLLDQSIIQLENVQITDAHLRTRIGFLLPERRDKWWEITSTTDSHLLSREISDLVANIAVPYVKILLEPDAVRSLWESGQSPGLTEFQRVRFLRKLKNAVKH